MFSVVRNLFIYPFQPSSFFINTISLTCTADNDAAPTETVEFLSVGQQRLRVLYAAPRRESSRW